MRTPFQDISKGMEMAITHDEDVKPSNGLAAHMESFQTPEEIKAEKAFVLKVDLIILPLLVLSVFLASLDRGDTGYAYNAGMGKELSITSNQLSVVVSMFYVGYFIMSFPATLLLKKITGNVQIATALWSWGLFTTLMCIATSWQALAGLRVLIGCGEALNQAAGLYLTFFYKRNQLASRGAFYFGVYALAGSMNGLLGYGILKNLNGARGWLAWRWIFLIEGLMSIFSGFIIIFLLPSSPEKLRRGFSAAEKDIALRRYREGYNVQGDTKIRGSQILKVLKDPHSWMYIAIYGCTNVSLAAFGNFLPIIVKSFGFSTLDTNLLTVPVWFVTAIAIIVAGFVSDRLKQRGWLLMLCFAIASIGYIMLLARPSPWVQYTATFFMGAGTYPTSVLLQTWYASNMIGYTKRATITALTFMTGQLFSIASSYAYSDPPYYYRGNGFALAMMATGCILSGIHIRLLIKRNNVKVTAQGSAEAAAKRSLGVEEIQDAHPDFMYYL